MNKRTVAAHVITSHRAPPKYEITYMEKCIREFNTSYAIAEIPMRIQRHVQHCDLINPSPYVSETSDDLKRSSLARA